MKRIFTLAFILIMISAPAAFAYDINGFVDDWGIDLNNAVNGGSGYKLPDGSTPGGYTNGYLDNNTPTGGNDIDYWTEDNADENSGVNTHVHPGYTHYNNKYDAEAIYFDNDADYAYIALITGLSYSESEYPAGDLFINVGSAADPFNSTAVPSAGSTYAVNVLSGDLYNLSGLSGQSVLQDVTYTTAPNDHSAATPWRFDYTQASPSYNLASSSDLIYRSNANAHYVIETRIALDTLGLKGVNSSDIWLHWTMECGNDVLKLNADTHAVPEPTTLFLFGSSLLGLFGFRRKISA
jgi:hypothetical protein